MSKLFDTLEKINRNEVAPDLEHPGDREISSSKRKWPLYLLGLVLSGTFLFWGINFIHFQQQETITTNHKNLNLLKEDKTPNPAQVTELETARLKAESAGNIPSPIGDKHEMGRMIALNNKGVALVADDQHWQGIYFFEKARKLQPRRIEPLINLAVALTELHLYGPARRYFDEAVKLDSNNPLLHKNMDIAAGLGLLKE